MISIIDYGSGNIKAIINVFKRLNISASIVDSPEQIRNSSKLILPGVGSFDDSIRSLNNSGLRSILDEKVLNYQTPILGICVGMQIMAGSSDEGVEKGLGWFENSCVRKLDVKTINKKPHLPHMGWNSIKILNSNKIYENIDLDMGFYFLHSYYFDCRKENILTITSYGIEFPSSINRDNIFGFQFHPEKSHNNGEVLLNNFANFN